MHIQGQDIIMVGIQAWDRPMGGNARDLALEFSKNNRVLYVNPPINRKNQLKPGKTDRMKRKLAVLQKRRPPLQQINKQLWVLTPKTIIESVNWLPSGALFNYFNALNAERWAKAILRQAGQLGFRDFLLFNDSSMFMGVHLKALLRPKVYLYYIRDNLVANPYWRKHGKIFEPKVIAEADVVVTNAKRYADYARQYNPNAYFVGQGCDLSRFEGNTHKLEEAEATKQLPNPVIGYAGQLTSRRIDERILCRIARAKPEWTLFLLGPQESSFRHSALHDLPNVHLPGPCPPEVLPRYLKGFDVCLNPQLVNPATQGNYPRKIDEYLAMGKPVVATRTPAMAYFEEYTYLADTPESYEPLIQRALEEDTPEKQNARRAFALSHTWTANTQAIAQAIHNSISLTPTAN